MEEKGTSLKKDSRERNNKESIKFRDLPHKYSQNTMCMKRMKKTSIVMKVMVREKKLKVMTLGHLSNLLNKKLFSDDFDSKSISSW
jgi:hypothetical protein